MDKSIFTDKRVIPDEKELNNAMGRCFHLWQEIIGFVYGAYPAAVSEWNFSGEKYGWSFRIKDKKRAIVYLLPRDGFFKVAFVFGSKAVEDIMNSDISPGIIKELKSARVYAEGRGLRITVKHKKDLKDIRSLIDIKVRN